MEALEHDECGGDRARRPGGLRYWWPVLAVAAVLLVCAGFVGLTWHLRANAYQIGAKAMAEFDGDAVDALIALVQSDKHTLAERNQAVWALGQIGDSRATLILQTFYTGQPCQHGHFLCQRELKKAIDRCGKNWAPAWLPFSRTRRQLDPPHMQPGDWTRVRAILVCRMSEPKMPGESLDTPL